MTKPNFNGRLMPTLPGYASLLEKMKKPTGFHGLSGCAGLMKRLSTTNDVDKRIKTLLSRRVYH